MLRRKVVGQAEHEPLVLERSHPDCESYEIQHWHSTSTFNIDMTRHGTTLTPSILNRVDYVASDYGQARYITLTNHNP